MTKKWVYSFGRSNTEGNRDLKSLLGGKGANLAEMSLIGLNVPDGFTITTETCLDFGKNKNSLTEDQKSQIEHALRNLEEVTGKQLGGVDNPLLLSVRSGAKISMPGMMDTVLNLGLNDETVESISKLTGDMKFAYDSYRRFIQMYSDVVMEVNTSVLESTLEDLKEARGVTHDNELTGEDFKELVRVFKMILLQESGKTFPQDPKEQLWLAINAVFKSWDNSRARSYREYNNIPHDLGTAVNIQSMVFGNRGETSATGVCFTRDPSTGEKKFYGEYLIDAQGEDVVAGIRTPMPINKISITSEDQKGESLEEKLPESYKELVEVYHKLEAHYKDMQDIEFTIENGKLYLLQTRNGKRTAAAALKIAVDLVEEGIITKKEAVLRIDPEVLNQLLHPRFDPDAQKDVVAKGLPASPGAASGCIVFDSEVARREMEAGKKVILVRQETSPEDINGMVASEGILTARGGMTSHAAVVARGMGKPCIAGCGALIIDEENKTVVINRKTYNEGDFFSIDGTSGEVISGEVDTIDAAISGDFQKFMGWADEFRTMKIRTNADTPEDAETAVNFGAEGIGLCRTEHMFFNPERILAVRRMIFASDMEERRKTLEVILPFQQKDFEGLFETMKGRPVNIRLLDPPLHEFLPHKDYEIQELAASFGVEFGTITDQIAGLEEQNPMLGHRGCRLGITYPEIYNVQVQAIMLAANNTATSDNPVNVEIMIPLISSVEELRYIKERIQLVIDETMDKSNDYIKYKIGTMIELPRAAIMAHEIAKEAEFFSFGTNDLTQTTFGLSRDDSGKFLPEYVSKSILRKDPFVEIDRDGVGFLVSHATKNGKKANPDIHIGICGEHGGDPASIDFCYHEGLDYVSCSPFRVPIARLAAAQSAIKQ